MPCPAPPVPVPVRCLGDWLRPTHGVDPLCCSLPLEHLGAGGQQVAKRRALLGNPRATAARNAEASTTPPSQIAQTCDITVFGRDLV